MYTCIIDYCMIELMKARMETLSLEAQASVVIVNRKLAPLTE